MILANALLLTNWDLIKKDLNKRPIQTWKNVFLFANAKQIKQKIVLIFVMTFKMTIQYIMGIFAAVYTN
jgi:hypothetical protein